MSNKIKQPGVRPEPDRCQAMPVGTIRLGRNNELPRCSLKSDKARDGFGLSPEEKNSLRYGENTDRNNCPIAKRETNANNDRKRYDGECVFCGFAEYPQCATPRNKLAVIFWPVGETLYTNVCMLVGHIRRNCPDRRETVQLRLFCFRSSRDLPIYRGTDDYVFSGSALI